VTDSSRWTEVRALFEQALELEGSDREAFLRDRCSSDPELKAEVESLLAADENAPSYLEERAADLAARDLSPWPSNEDGGLVEGTQLGSWRLLREIGEGGMSRVYLAERAGAGFSQRAAVKVMRASLSETAGARDRFRAERQILAALEHPNIARLLDGGETESGLPYLAMEYVEGRAITRYCDTKRCSLDERLAIFTVVCAAVQHAHQRLIVHRDLKPSNILVSPSGHPKLLDFGIAKLLADDAIAAAALPLTRAGVFVMTPEYAAPEQVLGREITTATDVHALGVVLYELLTGRRPYEIGSRTPSELERAICENEPITPSAALTESVGADNAWRLWEWKRGQKGDLDVIILKALRKEPTERYASPAALAGDVDRFRRRLPIEARPPSARYRARMFVRRHRWGVAAAALVLLSLAGGLAATAWQARLARAERDRALAAEVEARQKQQESSEITEFLLGIFRAADARTGRGPEATAREILAAGAEMAERELTTQPVVQAALLEVIGGIQGQLGLYDHAERLLEQSLEIRRAVAAGEAEIADSVVALGHLAFDSRNFPAAEKRYREALGLLAMSNGASESARAGIKARLAAALARQDKLDEAEDLSREALEFAREDALIEDLDLFAIIANRAVVQTARGELAAAADTYGKLLAAQEARLGGEHPDLAVTLNNLAYVEKRRGELAAAEQHYRRALAVQEAVYGIEHPGRLMILQNLGGVISEDPSRLDEVEAIIRRVAELQRQMTPGHWRLGTTLIRSLGEVLLTRKKYADAEPVLREGLTIHSRELGADVPQTLTARGYLAAALFGMGREREAGSLIEESLRGLEARAELDRRTRTEIERVAGHLEVADRPAEAARYRALLGDG
jgi:serine/threonine-protein kinase